jgi:hypothetical protein
VLANRVMMGLYRKSGASEYAPDIAIVPEISVDFISLTRQTPVVDTESIKVAPGTISAGMVSLTCAVPSVDTESIKVAPGSIVVDLFVPE